MIDPVDGLSRDNPASVPDLLEELAAEFRQDGFHLRPLIRKICDSDAYQRSVSSKGSAQGDRERAFFAARSVRQMIPEQWLASLNLVLGRDEIGPAKLVERSMQVLGATAQSTLVRDPFEWTPTSQTVVRQLSGPISAPLKNVDALFWSTLARAPSDHERTLVSAHSTQETLYALVHGNEFLTND